MQSKIRTAFLGIATLVFFLAGCKKYLDVKSDKSLAVPSTLKDAQAVLDNYSIFNTFYSSAASQSDDDYYLDDAYLATQPTESRINYTWDKEAYNLTQWINLYNIVFYANLAMETVAGNERTQYNTAEYNSIKGSALFFRGYAFWHIAQHWAPPYDKALAETSMGIPLRLNPDASVTSTRATVAATYAQMISDLKEAATLLPNTVPITSRPLKTAAFGALARTYLSMKEYALAGLYADSCLQLYNTLLDYNTLNATAAAPFARFNPEVILHTQYIGTGMLGSTNFKADSVLFKSYAVNDLRRKFFYVGSGVNPTGFKGSYTGTTSGANFNGLAVDEIYLIRAESKARAGDVAGAIADLNTLLAKRWATGTFVPYTATDGEDALVKVLSERRKELVGRGLRWSDLRRLNTEPRFAKTLVRKVAGITYTLPPNDKRYTFFIPAKVIELTGMPQNVRE